MEESQPNDLYSTTFTLDMNRNQNDVFQSLYLNNNWMKLPVPKESHPKTSASPTNQFTFIIPDFASALPAFKQEFPRDKLQNNILHCVEPVFLPTSNLNQVPLNLFNPATTPPPNFTPETMNLPKWFLEEKNNSQSHFQ